MPQLSIREIPDDMLAEIRTEAQDRHTSINTIVRLAIEEHTERRRRQQRLASLLPSLDQFRQKILERRAGVPLPDSTELIGEDRAR